MQGATLNLTFASGDNHKGILYWYLVFWRFKLNRTAFINVYFVKPVLYPEVRKTIYVNGVLIPTLICLGLKAIMR